MNVKKSERINPLLLPAELSDDAMLQRFFAAPLTLYLLSFILTINDFNIIYVMTRGGPGSATQIFATYSYQVAFNQLRWGRGVTISIYVVPLLIALIPLVSRYLLRERAA